MNPGITAKGAEDAKENRGGIEKFSVSPQGCTSKPTPNWDGLGCSGIPREGGAIAGIARDRNRILAGG
jgi:hypothetical protein